MKKLLFAAHDMNIGGIETSLLTLLNYLVERDYEITLILEKKQGIFLSQLDSKIKVIEYAPNASKLVLYRKLVNLGKRVHFLLKYYHKFDFSASYATYSLMSAFVTRNASTNNALWGHADYMALFQQDEQKVKKFFEQLHFEKFQHYIFVSQVACKSFLNLYPEMKEKVEYINNIIDANKIENLKEEPIEEQKSSRYTFINVGRHDERQKKLSRIIEASKRLKEEGFLFKVLFIGEGQDTEFYQKKIKENALQDTISLLGAKKNPYPYMNLADSILLSSDYEGYPVVFLEAFILHKPIITTDVSDAQEQIEGKFGKVVTKDIQGIYEAMKEFIEKGYSLTKTFCAETYNKEVIQKLEQII